MEANELRRYREDGGTCAQDVPAQQSERRERPIELTEPAADPLARLEAAVSTLERQHPSFSASTGLTLPQRVALLAVAVTAIGGGLHSPGAGLAAAQGLCTAAFAALLVVRLLAIREALAPPVLDPAGTERLVDQDLPAYTILVALYHETAVVPQLVEALIALDYPPPRLDIILVLETGDDATLNALLAAKLPDQMRIVVTPAGLPRTKPRALCYALTFARGDYVVVYDAEDEPEPGQLRAALAAFKAGGPELGCVQARLNVYNRHENCLTAQFAIEYTALFDAILKAYARLGIPVPLGGTSNHFPRRVLEHAGGWDPYNVTEDADIGIRLARLGYRVAILPSTTWEEAPPRTRDWFAQRTRWQKGWLQTYFVHMRNPRALWRDLGPQSWLWFQIVVGGGLLSAFAHPWLYVWVTWQVLDGGLELPEPATMAAAVWWAALATMVMACAAAIALALITLRTRGFAGLYLPALATPLYWLPVSLAAYCALWEWVRQPHYWAKTPHRPRPPTANETGV